jgi:GrpB-like predicted nucleotidyltransferase (UPF0157 family)
METHEEKLARVLKDDVEVVPYHAAWPSMFEEERHHLRACFPEALPGRIEHFGSTAVPGLAAKPVIDMLVEVRNLEEACSMIAPLLEAQGYDYFWRPTFGDDTPPWYAWFIKRDAQGRRTHHLHMLESCPAFDGHWNRLLFRDYLIAFPEIAREYAAIKIALASSGLERMAYADLKAGFIERATADAIRYFSNRESS